MNVIYSGTRNLYPAMKGAIRSLLEHNPDAKVYVLAEDDTLPFDLPCTVINVSGQQYFTEQCPNIKTVFTYMAMIRVCTPELIPDDRVIQLDVDTIVCDSLEPIWNLDMDGKWIAWCEELYGTWKLFFPRYYNFGVAVLNLEQMRKDKATKKMVYEMNTNKYPFADQDVMNLYAVPERTVDLPNRYNESFCCGYTEHPAIVHYAGYPDWYTSNAMPRWWLRDRYKDGE
jgi:lipopolysaccharide biosynthesis glycosyltransferase